MRPLLALAALLIAAAPASGATVRMSEGTEREGGRTYVYGQIAVTAQAGEVNALELAYDDRDVVVRDTSAPLTGGGRCANADPHTVVCSGAGLDGINEIRVDLGDGADRARAPRERGPASVILHGGPGDDVLAALSATAEGGDGNDTLEGGAGTEILDGGAGDDTLDGHGEYDYLDGGTGDDVVRGGEGHDVLLAGGVVDDRAAAGVDRLEGGPGNDTLDDQDGLGGGVVGPDTLDGGEGRDAVYSYLLRDRPVTVELPRPDGHGEVGENDALTGIEDVYGGGGDDTLIGDDGPNRLDGGRGTDEIRGGGGADDLASGVAPSEPRPNAAAAEYGPDEVHGDGGDDLIETLATLESEVTCGDGHDRVLLTAYSGDRAPSSRGPLVSGTCERLAMGAVSLVPVPTVVRARSLTFWFAAARCCRHRMEIQTVGRRPKRLATAAVRAGRVHLRVADARRRRTLRAKVTNAGRNRMVWRFRRGF